MPYPAVAIVGRPNVGKSTLFNRLAGSRISIEDAVAGVTRDRVLYPLRLEDRTVDLIDTGGIGIVDKQKLETQVEEQIQRAISEATILLFLVDSRDGITPLDQDVAAILRKTGKPIFLIANKVDTGKMEDNLASFHALGFGDALPISAKNNRNIDDLEEAILSLLPPPEEDEEPVELRDLLKIAFVGRRNVGKSSIVNQLIGADRVIVSDIPGTTRDSVDIIIEKDGRRFVAIDTAGMRRRGQMDDQMEFYGHVRTERAIRRADICILMLDVMQDISKVDKRLGAFITEHHVPCIVTLNKWDLAMEQNPGITVEDFRDYIAENLPGLWYCNLAGISAVTGQNVWPLIDLSHNLYKKAGVEVRTAQINTALGNAFKKRRPKPYRGKIGKAYYATQVATHPPTFVVFCNNPAAFDDNFRRYLSTQFREALGYEGIPVKLIFKTTSEREVGRYNP